MNRRKGFTLVELVVVILILGILAGVAAPKMFKTSTEATENGLRQTLTVVRDAIELYQAKQGSLPPCTGTGTDFWGALKPYLRGPAPNCPVGSVGDTSVKASTTTPLVNAVDDTSSWLYNTNSGEFICNSSDNSQMDASLTYGDF
jgi:general secretion pathway protein G